MADIKIAGRIKAGTADNIAGYASEILFDDEASNKTVKEKLEGKQDTLTFDNVPTEGSNNPVKSGGVYQAIQSIDVSGQISGKADKSEMSVVAGTGANADKTTITLKSGTSATVLTQHQDVSEFLREGEVFGSGDDSAASFNSYADTVWNKQQTLSESQKQQVRENIGITDLETIRNGAAAGATAIQSVTVGTTTTGAAGSSASVTNTGTATEPVLSFTIPQGAQGVNPFKGWWKDLTTLKNTITATDGDYAYVLPSNPNNPVAIYSYDETATSDNYWADSGRIFNPSNNQEFATGEELNLTGITEHIMFASNKLIKSGGVYSAFNVLIQLLRKVAYTENDAEETLNALNNLISGIDVPITGITIVGDASIVGSAVYVATLSPTDTTERDIIWSITSGNQYAAVLSDGTLIVIDNGSVVLKCESATISSVYDTKTITVTDSASHFMPLTSNTSDTVGSLTPAKSSYTSISSDGMQFTAGSNDGLSYGYNANFKTFIFDLKYSKSSLAWQYFFGNWAGSNVSTLGFAIKIDTNEVWYTTNAGDYTANKSLSENTWHRIGIQIISSTSAALWIDGEKIITPTFTSRDITHYLFGNNWRFQAADGTRALNGYIKNLKIYDNVLSDDFMTIKTQIL